MLIGIFALACALFAAAPALSALPPKFGGTLNVAVPERIARLDPAVLTQDADIMVASLIFDALIEPVEGGGFAPALLDAMPVVSDDGLTYYFKLREDVKFHDGSTLDTADVFNTFTRLIRNRQSPYAWLLQDVEGANDYRSGKARALAGFKLTDAFRFEVRLAGRQPDFLKYLCFPALSITPSQDNHFDPPIGTGPFKFAGRGARGEIKLAANKDDFRGRPYLDTIVVKQIADERDRLTELKRGELDVADVPLNGLSRAESEMFGPEVRCWMKRMFFLDVNTKYKALSTPELRAAVSKAIDRNGIAKILLNGNGVAENNISASLKAGPLRSAGESGAKLPLWYQERAPALGMIADKLYLNLTDAGLPLSMEKFTAAGLLQYPEDKAPAFILRSLPVLMGLQQSVDETLFSREYASRSSAMVRRLMPDAGREPRRMAGAAIMLFSVRPSYIRRDNVCGLAAGPFGAPALEGVFLREPFEPKEPAKPE